ncbi:MAG: AAA family ATPase [Oceanospirillales bacterium]|nr:AAA family ATPase [Oceanospirillales bacterium]
MYIDKIQIENFRLLKKCTLDLRDKTTLIVGKNNTGKTSFAILLEKFLDRPDNFSFGDFPIDLRDQLFSIDANTNIDELSIRLVIRVAYSEDDDISVLSEFMLDLDASRKYTNVLLECQIDQQKIIQDQPDDRDERKKYIENNLSGKYLKATFYAFDDYEYTGDDKYYIPERDQLEEKSREDLRKLIHFQVIHARRNVASSEDKNNKAMPLAEISTKFFKRKSESQKTLPSEEKPGGEEKSENLKAIASLLSDTDRALNVEYSNVFSGFLNTASEFLDIDELKIISNIQSQSLIENSSKIIYGDLENSLPENHSGLGYLNILYLLLRIEVCREEFAQRSAPLNLLVVEEPEAHTHPQMQYVFADKIRSLIGGIPNLQALLTTHSSHIIAKSDFEDIRYLSKAPDQNCVEIRNFHTELKEQYGALGDDGESLFKFLKQYLSINSAELFFADKAIFVEGTTERILLPWFIQQHDKTITSPMTGGLSSQNITVMEVGANAKAFAPFLEFIGIKTLIITDIDTTIVNSDGETSKTTYPACAVDGSTHTSNESLKHFFSAPNIHLKNDFEDWHKKLLDGTLVCSRNYEHIKVSYQSKQNGYHARSFEDAFMAINLVAVMNPETNIRGLKNKSKLSSEEDINYYSLTKKVIDKKSDFAASILFAALTKDQSWNVPTYISEGLKWLHSK